jgi:hypothetical protein
MKIDDFVIEPDEFEARYQLELAREQIMAIRLRNAYLYHPEMFDWFMTERHARDELREEQYETNLNLACCNMTRTLKNMQKYHH